jgi:hypothetical protein
MRLSWGKIPLALLGHPAVRRAEREGHRGLEWMPWIILFAILADDDGRLTVGRQAAEPQDIAPLLPGATLAAVRTCLGSMRKLGFLLEKRGGVLQLSDEMRCFSSGKPSDQPDAVRKRVAKHRDRKRAHASSETPAVTPGNALHVTPEKRREDETRGDKNNPSASDTAAGKHETWLTPYADLWRKHYGGDMSIGPAIRPLAKLRAEHGDEETLRRWGHYLANTSGNFANAARFAATWGTWIEPTPLSPPRNAKKSAAEQSIANTAVALRGLVE